MTEFEPFFTLEKSIQGSGGYGLNWDGVRYDDGIFDVGRRGFWG